MKKNMNLWDAPMLRSRTHPEKVGLAEMVLGYFLGPLCVLVMTSVVSTYYLTYYRTYEDVVANGRFLTLLPLLSVIPMALSNVVVGILVGKTRTSQGKARPYLLGAAPILLISGIAVFCIPNLDLGLRMVWMAVTFNLFASIANPVYGTAHYLMVSLSTRDIKRRGQLSVIANIPAVAANGLVSSILMPLVLSWIKSAGSTVEVQGRWQGVMTVFSIIAFVGCILEYLFTRERITEEALTAGREAVGGEKKVPTIKQLKAITSDTYWWIIMVFYALYQAGVMFKGGFIFNIYCNEFFGDTVIFNIPMDAETVQSVLALISGIPLAAGMLFIWPLANRFGKRNVVIAGCVVSVAGSILCMLDPGNFWVVLLGQTFKGFSSIPGAYIMMALFADVLDHVEARFGFRADGISMSIYNAILTVVNGLAVSVFLLFYDGGVFTPSGVAEFFFVGFESIAHSILIVVLCFLNVEKTIEKEQAMIAERKTRGTE